MHAAALADLGLSDEWSYEAIEVSPHDFDERVRAMPGEGFAGANVTVPHKLAALAVADSASAAAAEIGAANTLVFGDQGIAAENTDATGIVEALPESAHGRRALVLGAGGSARAAVWALSKAGAAVSIWNRTRERAEHVAADLGAATVEPDPVTGALPVERFELIVNATAVGLKGDAQPGTDLKALRLDADALNGGHVVIDLVYGAAPTQLRTAALERNATVVDGLEVLVQQGAASLSLWTGAEPSLEVMRAAALGASP